jgi:hypothetical protein
LAFSVVVEDSAVIPKVVIPVLLACFSGKQDYERTVGWRGDTALSLAAPTAMNFLSPVVESTDLVRKVVDRLEGIHFGSRVPGQSAHPKGGSHSIEEAVK